MKKNQRITQAAAAGVMILAGLVLTGCSSGDSGEFIGLSDGNDTDVAIAVIDGDTLTVTQPDCDGTANDEGTVVGTLSDDRTSVVWESADGLQAYYITDDEASSATTLSDESLVVGAITYTKRDSSQGETIDAKFEAACAE